MPKRFIPCLFLVFFSLSAVAQVQSSMVVSDGISIRNDYGYELIGRLRDRILLFRDKFEDFEVQAFDAQMHFAWSRELDDMERHGVQILSVVGGRNDFSIIYKLRRRGQFLVKVHKYDPGANLIDSMTIIDYGDRVFTPPALEVVESEDRNYFVVYNSAERNKLESICFRLDKMQVAWRKDIALEDNYFGTNDEAMALTNAGDFFLISEKNNRRAKLDEHAFHILRVNAGGDALTRTPAPDFLTNHVQFTYDNQNQQLVGAGLYSDKNKDRANGVFFLRTTTENNRAATIHAESFDDKFISIVRQKDVEDYNRGITEADIREIVLRRDGGVVLVMERNHEVQRGSSAGRGFWRDGMRMIVDFYFDDVLVVAIQPDGQAQWKTVLHKKQYSQDDDGTFSSFFLLRTADQLRFLFNDEIKYENTCSEYVLSPLGDFDRNSLLTTANQNLRLRFRDAIQISASECLVPSEFRNKLKLVLLKF